MSFIALLLALLLEQARPPTASAGIDKLLFHWADWLRHTLDAGDKRHAWTAWGLAMGLGLQNLKLGLGTGGAK